MQRVKFKILPVRSRPPIEARGEAFLISDNWDDFGFKTQFWLNDVTPEGERIDVGAVKIANFEMGRDIDRPELPRGEFASLSEASFSLGQDDGYHQTRPISEASSATNFSPAFGTSRLT